MTITSIKQHKTKTPRGGCRDSPVIKRGPVVLLEDPCSVPNILAGQLITTCNSSSGELDTVMDTHIDNNKINL